MNRFADFKRHLDHISQDGETWLRNAEDQVHHLADEGNSKFVALVQYLDQISPDGETWLQNMEGIINGQQELPRANIALDLPTREGLWKNLRDNFGRKRHTH